MSKCDLYLENYTNHYTGGQTIIGHALCTFTSPKEVHGVVIHILGKASTHWNEYESRYNATTQKNESHSVSYSGSHKLVNVDIDLLQTGGGAVTIPQGVHKYPFTYTLPLNLPSTFCENLGKIEYYIKAVVKRPLLRFNYEAESRFVVLTPFDLNNNPSLRNPETRTKQKETYFCCWSKGTITVKAKIPRSGIAIREPLPLCISVENLSQTNVVSIKCKIKKTTKFFVTTPSQKIKHEMSTIYTDQYSGVGAHGENTYNKTILINNASLISNFIDCNVINVGYVLELTFVLSGMHTSMEIEIPVTVGHIPIGAQPPVPQQPTRQIGFNTPEMPTTPSYSAIEPPPPYNPAFINASVGATGGGSVQTEPSAPNAPTMNGKNDDWELAAGESTNQGLPTYDEALKCQMKL